MRTRVLGCVLVAMIAVTTVSRGQWLHYPTEGVPRRADGTPDLSAAPPRLPDGKPDFSGIWHVALRNPCDERTSFIPCNSEIGGSPLALDLGAQLPDGLPYQPWAAALVKERVANGHQDDPHVRCLPDNPPRTWGMPHLTKIVHTSKLLVMLYEVNAMYRQIFTDRRPLPDDPTPGWNGYSTAHWEGDTLVITTAGFRDELWIDMHGSPMSSAAQMTERLRRPTYGTLEVQITVDDLKTYTRPWTVSMNQGIELDTELIDEFCLENEKSYSRMKAAANVSSAQSPGSVAQPGAVAIEPPTTGALGIEWRIQGDDNRNASVTLAWRRTGETAWRDGLPLLRLQGEAVQQGASFHYVAPNMFAGSVFDLAPNTSYDVRLRLTDPDAPAASRTVERTVTARTRPVPTPATGGAVYHVYPRDYTGPKLEPNFTSLMAAYNTGANGADFVNSFQPRVKAGDVIVVHAGTYREDRRRYAGPNSTLFDGTFYLTADGTADKPIVIKGAGDGDVIFDGGGNAVLFDLTAADYNYIEGITVRNTDVAFLLGRKRIVGAVGFTLKNSRIENVGRGVFTDWGGARDFYIADNVFIGRNDPTRLMGWIGRTWQDLPGFPQPLLSEYGVKVYGSGHVIAHNRVENFHDGIDHATYGDPDGWPENPIMPVSTDVVGNDIRNVDDNCIEADGSAQNFRVIENRCFNMAHRALSTQPTLGGPTYFIRNIVYNAPEGGALKITANSAGVLVYNNTFLSEVHQMGPASNLHFRNNLVLAQGAWPEVFSIETFTPWSTSDYNGFSAAAAPGSSLFAWAAPADSTANYDSRAARPVQSFADLKTYSARTGQDGHSRMIDWSIFRKASPPANGDPTRLYRPEDDDFTLAAGSAAIDAGAVLPGVTDGFTGQAPDLGALESGRVVPAYGPRPLSDQP